MKKLLSLAVTAALLGIPSAASAALLTSPDRVELTELANNTTVAKEAVLTVQRDNSNPTKVTGFLYLDVGGGAFASFGGASVSLSNGTSFSLEFNGYSTLGESAVYRKDTGNNLIVTITFDGYDDFAFCTGVSPVLSLNTTLGAVQVPISDSVNANFLSFSGLSGTMNTSGLSACTQQSQSQNLSSTPAPTPAKYSGPEFSSLSLKSVMHGSSTTLTGKRLSQVSSIEIGGKAATFTATSDTELSLTPAADLAPGTYDLVINSAAGKLTHINAVRIQAALRSFSVTTRAENRITEEQYQEHSLIASMQQSELTKARCIVNGPNLAQAKAQAERLCALVKAANPNIETTVVEARSTVRNSAVFARVTYGWN